MATIMELPWHLTNGYIQLVLTIAVSFNASVILPCGLRYIYLESTTL
jgi:hypothetical protein